MGAPLWLSYGGATDVKIVSSYDSCQFYSDPGKLQNVCPTAYSCPLVFCFHYQSHSAESPFFQLVDGFLLIHLVIWAIIKQPKTILLLIYCTHGTEWFANPSSRSPDERPCSPPLLFFLKVGNSLRLSNSIIFGSIQLYQSIFGNVNASPFTLETFQTSFDNDNWPKEASEVGDRAICSGAILKLWNHSFFDRIGTLIVL